VIDYPPTDVMVDLLLLDNSTSGGFTHDGRLAVRTAKGPAVIDPASLDVLSERGWLEYVGTDSVKVTERGRYWLTRWVKAHRGTLRGAK
jgi:hypothetical protein